MDAALDIERLLAANAEGGKGEGPFMCGAFRCEGNGAVSWYWLLMRIDSGQLSHTIAFIHPPLSNHPTHSSQHGGLCFRPLPAAR